MKTKFNIDINIYPENIIKQSISDFKEVSFILYRKGVLTIEGESKSEIDEIFNEFMNYTIGLINE